MPAYYNRSNYGDEGGGSSGLHFRGRGRGRGGYSRGGRDGRGGGGGGRGYNRGGNRHPDDRYKWNEGRGGRQRGSGGYRDDGYGHNRYRDGPGSSHHMWNSGSERGDRGSHMFRSSGPFSSKGSRLALDILNAELAQAAGGDRDSWHDMGPARKVRRMDVDRVCSPPMLPQRDRQFDPRKLKGSKGKSGYARGPVEWCKMTQAQIREMEMARLEMPQPEKKENKDTEKKTSAAEGKKEVKEGEPESATAEGGDDPPADMKQSDSGDDSGKQTKAASKDNGRRGGDEIHEETSVVIPRAALKCHMCDMPKFPSTKSYLKHVEGKQHAILANCFHARNMAVLDVLMSDSKLACKWRPKKKGGSKRCLKCECFMSSTIQEHCQTTEHTLVSQYSRVRCCRHKYNRANLEEHRLSLRHLKHQWDIDVVTMEMQRKEDEEDEKRKATDATFHKEVHDIKLSGESEEELTPDTLPPHDPTKPAGLKFLYKETSYRCNLCRSVLRNPQHAEYHFRSVEHYNHLCQYLTAEEEKKKELEREAKKLEMDEKKDQERKTKESVADEDDNLDDDNCEDMNNMETVDEAVEDPEADVHMADETGVADEDEDAENGAAQDNANTSGDSDLLLLLPVGEDEDIGDGVDERTNEEEGNDAEAEGEGVKNGEVAAEGTKGKNEVERGEDELAEVAEEGLDFEGV